MRLITLSQKSTQNAVASSAEIIRRGGIIIAPTDTVYGLLANALDENAVRKIFAAKVRDQNKPLPVFVKNISMAKKFAKISRSQEKIVEENWPGKVTFVLEKKNDAKLFAASGPTVALRIPFYHFINSLLETLNVPLCGTSANISGLPASTKIDEVILQFGSEHPLIDAAINAGDLPESSPSRIVDLTTKIPKVLRN